MTSIIPETPVALTIAGSDCSGGAGIQADLKACLIQGVYGLSVVTCVVAEVPGKVVEIHPVPISTVRSQLEILLQTYPIRAIKTGMLFSSEQVEEVVSQLRRFLRERPDVPLVIDPVMVATSGDSLMEKSALEIVAGHFLPMGTLLTPNLAEAAVLLRQKRIPGTVESMKAAAQALSARFGTAVLLKGGHSDEGAVDLLAEGDTLTAYESARIENVATHGTGCTLSAAIAAALSRGLALRDAIAEGKAVVSQAISHSHRWGDGTLQALRLEGS